jgi:hypothetical protein
MMVKKLMACVVLAGLAGLVGCSSGTGVRAGEGKEEELAAREGAQAPPGKAAPLAEKYLLEGKLAEGEKALQARLKDAKDDQARFGLGVIQFLQAYEHVGASLYKYGLRTEKSFLRPPPQVKAFLPQNPNPEPITSAALRQILQTYLDDLAKAEATLAEVRDPAVKLPLHVGLLKMDPFGQGKPISAAFLFAQAGAPEALSKQAETLVIGFDRGDVAWLRGYCHVLMAGGELALALDGQRAFDCGAHLFFEKPETAFPFLVEKRRPFDAAPFTDVPMWTDALTFLHHLTRLPVKEPERGKAALAHLEAAVGQAKEMWKHILAETDDDNEWIPNPKQTGVLGVKVTQEMVAIWLETLDEGEQILQGKKLIPFWRGTVDGRGVNLRRVLTEPQKTFDPLEWAQGTAAAPYLEKGPITKLADPATGARFNQAFGGPFNAIGFGFWFQ